MKYHIKFNLIIYINISVTQLQRKQKVLGETTHSFVFLHVCRQV